MLLEKVIRSAIVHTSGSASSNGYIMTLADSFAASGTILFRHILTKLAASKTCDIVYVLCLQHSPGEWQNMLKGVAGPKLQSSLHKIRYLEPSSASTSLGLPPELEMKVRALDLYSLSSKVVLPAMQRDYPGSEAQEHTPSVKAAFFIDSLGLLLAHNSLPSILTWLENLTQGTFVRSVVQLVHVDSLPRSCEVRSMTTAGIVPQTSAHPTPSRILETLWNRSKTYIQCLPLSSSMLKPVTAPVSKRLAVMEAAGYVEEPQPPRMVQPLIGVLILHRKTSSPKLAVGRELCCIKLHSRKSDELVLGVDWPIVDGAPITSTSAALASVTTSPAVRGFMGVEETEGSKRASSAEATSGVKRQPAQTIRKVGPASSSESADSSPSASSTTDETAAAFAKLSAGLSFSVQLTEKQRAQRAAVELPYMHQGQASLEVRGWEAKETSAPQTLSESLMSGFAEFAADGFGMDAGQLGIPISSVGLGEIEEEEDFEDDEEL